MMTLTIILAVVIVGILALVSICKASARGDEMIVVISQLPPVEVPRVELPYVRPMPGTGATQGDVEQWITETSAILKARFSQEEARP